jgi:peptidyl-tRNA hydrolase, PTH2 family
MARKLALVVRTDLAMGKGKIAAQAAHAAVLAVLTTAGSPDFRGWLDDGQPKVVLKVADDDELGQIMAAAQAAGLPVAAVHDAGRTQLEPGTRTCCAIGPAEDDRINAVTGGLSLL